MIRIKKKGEKMYTVDEMTQNAKAARTIGSNIEKFLKARTMSQKRLAEMTGAYPNNITNYVQGRVIPNVMWLIKISKALEVSIDELTDGVDAGEIWRGE